MFWLARARFNLRLSHVLDIRLLPVVRFGTHGGDVQTMCSFHIRGVVEAADERVDSNINCALDVSVSPQGEVRQPTLFARSHAQLHCRARSCHRQIEGVLKLDLLCLRESEGAGNVGERLLGKDDCSGTHRPDRANKQDVFDGLGKSLQAPAILLQESQTRTIYLTVNKQTDETLMAQARRERQLALRYIKRCLCFAERTIVQTRDVFVRRVAHRGVVAIDV